MPFQLPRPLFVLASVLTAAGVVLAVAGCSHVTPLGPDPVPVSLAPARDLGSPIVMQIMRSQLPTPAGQCPAGSIALFGSEPDVPRTSAVLAQPVQGGTATPAAASATPPAPGAGVACYRAPGRDPGHDHVRRRSLRSPPTGTNRGPPGTNSWSPFPPPMLLGVDPRSSGQAYNAGDAVGISVAGKLWQAPQPRRRYNALRAAQISLLSRTQAVQLYRLLVP